MRPQNPCLCEILVVLKEYTMFQHYLNDVYSK